MFLCYFCTSFHQIQSKSIDTLHNFISDNNIAKRVTTYNFFLIFKAAPDPYGHNSA